LPDSSVGEVDNEAVVNQLMERCATRVRLVHACVSRRRGAAGIVVLALLAMAASAQAQYSAPPSAMDSVRVPILVYHSVAPHHPGQTPAQIQLDVDTAVFQDQMNYLAEHKYHVISLERLVDALKRNASLPERAVVITFDDGWANQYHHAFPVLRQHDYTATFFIYTRPIGRDDSLYMNWDQVRELKDAGMTIGSHSRTHPQLTTVDPSTLREEVENSRKELEQHLGTAPDLFAYPYGAWDAQAVDDVRDAGYRAARAYPYGPWNTPADLYALRSILVTDDMRAFERALGGP
jgi:peptidoglycan/xylan/chitin deacetylase (PgdA/CDA1 family)